MKAYHPLKWDLQERIKRVWKDKELTEMKEDTIFLLKKFANLLGNNTHYRSDEFPKILITIDNDYDGYASAKQVHQYFSVLGVSNEYIEFIPLRNHGKDTEINIREQDLLVVTDASLLNINHNNKGKIWWIDHHNMTVIERMKIMNLKNVRTMITKNTNDERLKGLSAGLFTHLILYTLLEEFGIELEDTFEKETKLDALMSMISDMMPIEEYSGIYMGILEAEKPNFYEESKTMWDRDNKSYFGKYTSRINNLIRMERFDLINSLILGKGGEFIKRDIERMHEDRKKLMDTYFQPLTPEFYYELDNNIVQMYQVPVESNSIMKNHKGLLASMKTPKDRNKWITLSRVRTGNKYNYSVRTNIQGNLHRYLNQHMDTVEVGGHLQAFGITIPITSEYNLFQVLTNYIKQEDVKGEVKEAIDILELAEKGCIKELIWEIAKENERRIHPNQIRFQKEDFKEIKVHQKRTVYTLEIDNEHIYEVVSFDLYEKDEIIATPMCKEGVFDKYKVDILERG